LLVIITSKHFIMSAPNENKEGLQEQSKDQEKRDAERIETNKTDPQITELKGFVDPKEPLEEEGTLNPLTGNVEGKE
jgi:hypothetical protein